jgi:hypothetical protein
MLFFLIPHAEPLSPPGLLYYFFLPHAQNAISDQKILVRRKVVKYFVIEVEQNGECIDTGTISGQA